MTSSKWFCCVAKLSKERWSSSISTLILRNLSAKSLRLFAPFSIFTESSQVRCSREPQTGQGSWGFKLRRNSATTTGMSSWIIVSLLFCKAVSFSRICKHSAFTFSSCFCFATISLCKRTNSLWWRSASFAKPFISGRAFTSSASAWCSVKYSCSDSKSNFCFSKSASKSCKDFFNVSIFCVSADTFSFSVFHSAICAFKSEIWPSITSSFWFSAMYFSTFSNASSLSKSRLSVSLIFFCVSSASTAIFATASFAFFNCTRALRISTSIEETCSQMDSFAEYSALHFSKVAWASRFWAEAFSRFFAAVGKFFLFSSSCDFMRARLSRIDLNSTNEDSTSWACNARSSFFRFGSNSACALSAFSNWFFASDKSFSKPCRFSNHVQI